MDARVTVKQNSDFRRIYRRGRSAVSGGVVVYCLKNRQGMSRLGVPSGDHRQHQAGPRRGPQPCPPPVS